MERWQDGARTLREYIDRSHNVDRKIEALERMGEVLLRLGQGRPAEQALEEAVTLGRRNAGQLRRGLYYAAQARYQQGELVLHQYEAVRIEGDVRSLRQRLQRKSDLLARAAEIYADTVSFHDPATATAALYRIGYSYEQFAQSLRNAPVPHELNEQDQQAYREQLETFVVPIEERALNAYESGYRRALELHIYNRWTQDIRRALERLNDSLYPPLREIGAEVQLGDMLPRLDPIEEIHR